MVCRCGVGSRVNVAWVPAFAGTVGQFFGGWCEPRPSGFGHRATPIAAMLGAQTPLGVEFHARRIVAYPLGMGCFESLEAWPRIELGFTDLQSVASPLRHQAPDSIPRNGIGISARRGLTDRRAGSNIPSFVGARARLWSRVGDCLERGLARTTCYLLKHRSSTELPSEVHIHRK